MTDITISMRIGRELHEKMKMHAELNWSALMRGWLSHYVENAETHTSLKKKELADKMDAIRRSTVKGGKSGTDIIREWRNKRK